MSEKQPSDTARRIAGKLVDTGRINSLDFTPVCHIVNEALEPERQKHRDDALASEILIEIARALDTTIEDSAAMFYVDRINWIKAREKGYRLALEGELVRHGAAAADVAPKVALELAQRCFDESKQDGGDT